MNLDIVDIDHVAIEVTDLDRSLEFYHDILGLPIRDRDRFEAGVVPYVAVVAGGRHIHLVPTDEREAGDVAGDHICFLVRGGSIDTSPELDDLIQQLEAAGIEIEAGEPYKRYGAYGRAWAVYVRDPDGRRVELKIH